MRGFLRFAMALFLAACMIQMAGAAVIDYNLRNIGGDRWRYDYTITNDSDDDYLYGFSIYFDNDLYYSGLNLEVEPSLWDEFEPGWGIWQGDWEIIFGDPFGYNDGNISVFNLGVGLDPHGILEGLSVSFNWLDAGTTPAIFPGNQSFELFDAGFNSLGLFGNTRGGDMPTVPEPQTFMLLGTGLLGLAAYYRRKRS
jgi:hypothetical protein